MKFTYYVMALLLLMNVGVMAQQNEGPVYIGSADGHTYVPSLASRMNELTPSTVRAPKEAQDGRSYRVKRDIVPGKGRQGDILSENPHRLEGKVPGKLPDLTWIGAFSNSSPTDPALAVGPDHVFVVFNTGFAIYDKDGNELVGQTAPNPAIFPSSGCCDLTVSYDPIATSATNSTPGRWVVSFLGGGAQVAVSDGPDPVTSGWNVYNINTINDYQKLSVWSDGYYVSDQANGNRVYAMERQAMLDGESPGNVSIQGFSLPNFSNFGFASVQVLNISDDMYPAAGNATVVFFQDDAYAGVDDDSIKFWDLDVDFDTPANSTISTPQEVLVTPFISIFDGAAFDNLSQPGGGADIDALQGIVMNQAQYKKFPTYNSAIFNFVIDIGTGNEQAAIRWYEFRQPNDGDPWTMEQEGTFASTDGTHFWHGSMIMDTQGNIGMGFTAMGNASTSNGPDQFVSSYYTGRLASDPNGTMTIAPQLIAAGAGNIPNLRYGDYSKIDLDPSDYKRMYFINEYMSPNRADVVGRFQIAPDFNDDVGVIDITAPVDGALTATEDVTITIRNFGLVDASGFDVNYEIDSGGLVTENFAGTIAAGMTMDYTFTAQGDFSVEGQTYSITAATDYATDEDNGNDSFTKDVTHVFANDIGIAEITSPMSGEGLGNEDVTILIENFGTAAQSNFMVSYSIDGGTPVEETVAGPVDPGMTLSYTFTAQANLSATGSYVVETSTLLAGDSVAGNNTMSVTVENISCQSYTNSTSQPIGPNAGDVTESIITVPDNFDINDVNVTINLEHTFTGDLDIFLIGPDGTSVELSTDNGGTGENMTGTIFDDEAADPITSGSAPFTGSFQPEGNLSDFDTLMSAGDWTLRITDDANADGGQLLNWTLQLCSDNLLSINDEDFSDGSELIILSQANNQFNVTLPTTQVNDRLILTVTNMLGQRLLSYPLENENGVGYEYDLDMSYVSSGVYIIRLGNETQGSAKRIVVK